MCGLFQRETEKAVDHCGKIRYIIVSYSAVRQTDAPLLQTFPEEETVMEQNLTNGSVMKHILRFSLPYLLAYFLQTLYGMADLFIIGQFEGVAGTTAVAVGSQVMHLITVMLVGLAMGSTVLIGRAVGAGDRKRAAAGIGNTVTLFMTISLVMTAALLLFLDLIVTVISTPEEAVAGMKAYLTICFIGIPFITAYNILSSIFRGLGDSKSPMCFIAVACAANIALDYLFMGAMHLGPSGAALGTTLSQAISVVASLIVILRRKNGIRLQKQDLRPQRSVMGELLQVGLPITFQDLFVQISFMFITAIANRRGLTDAAAVGIVEKFIGFVFLVPSSMQSTVSAIGAQNIGAGKPERAVRTMWYASALCAGFGLVVAVSAQFIAEPIVGIFTDDTAVMHAGGQYLRGYVIDCLLAGIHFCFSGYFCAIGKSGISFLHNMISILLARVPGAYLASLYFPDTLLPMGLATAVGSFVSVVVCLTAYCVLMHRKKPARA